VHTCTQIPPPHSEPAGQSASQPQLGGAGPIVNGALQRQSITVSLNGHSVPERQACASTQLQVSGAQKLASP